MKIIIQRVQQASITINSNLHNSIQKGLLVLVGITDGDTSETVDWICNKIVNMRIFADANNAMNLSVLDVHADVLLVSQFTLYGDARKGNRPSFISAAKPEFAIPVYEMMIKKLSSLLGKPIATGVFGADMQVALINDGPVTILLEK
jgi:D-aminoacyl-tRNA deacylase